MDSVDVFIVEDSAVLRERLAALLEDIGNLRITGYAESVAEATDSFARLVANGAAPHVAILDIQLTAGNGLEVLRFIKKHAPATTAIMLTNYAYPQYKQRCAEEGADYFFDKSEEFMKVREVLEQMARKAG